MKCIEYIVPKRHARCGHFSIVRLLLMICVGAMMLFLSTGCRLGEQQLEPELVATIHVDPELFPSGCIHEEWHAVYEKYDRYPGTWVHPHEYYQSQSTSEWPELDLENYTYIITYSQEIESLSYNVWDTINAPVFSGAKEGHMVLNEEIEPYLIYIYRIPKMRINNPDI